MAGVPNLWYTYHWWYVERLQVVRRKFLFYQKSKIDFDGKGKNKQAGVFEEVIDTIMLKELYSQTQVSLKTAAQNF
jgi:hypothetical protein